MFILVFTNLIQNLDVYFTISSLAEDGQCMAKTIDGLQTSFIMTTKP